MSTAPVPDPAEDPEGAAAAAGRLLRDAAGGNPSALVVLGSGWGEAVDRLGEPVGEAVPFTDLGLPAASVAGHGGSVLPVRTPGGRLLLVAQGRTHAYEGHPLARVVHVVRAAVAAGVGVVALTNAAGGVRPGLQVGQALLISDHVNLTASTPLVGPRFLDLTDAWSPRLRALAQEADPSLDEGVYACLGGPQYETPAEIRALAGLGVDLVGMSTVHECIAARAEGAEVLGLSLVTNAAAGVTGEQLDHAEVLAAGRAESSRLGGLLATVLDAA